MKSFSLVLCLLCAHLICISQENIPRGTWRLHLSFNDLDHLAISNDRVFAATEIGLLLVDKAEQEITSITKIDGLSSMPITTLAFDDSSNKLMVGHENGLVSILQENTLREFNALAIATSISGSRRISHISVDGSIAYISTDFGVAVFDLTKEQIIETYRDLGEAGEQLVIYESVVFEDSLFLATAKGVLAGSLTGSTNLLDFRSWKRYNSGTFDTKIESITVFDGGLYAAIDQSGIYRLSGGIWNQLPFLHNEEIRMIRGTQNSLIITTGEGVWISDAANVSQIGSTTISDPDAAIGENNGSVWIADGQNGLLLFTNENLTSIKPNGPSNNGHWNVFSSEQETISLKGGYSTSLNPLGTDGLVDRFENGQWESLTNQLTTDVVDYAHTITGRYFATFGAGLEKLDENGSLIFNQSNSPLAVNDPVEQLILISSVESVPQGLWVMNYKAVQPLHFLSNGLTWSSFSVPHPLASFAVDLLVDRSENIWMVIDPNRGGGIVVFNSVSGQAKYLNNTAGMGGLPTAVVHSIASDREGQVWVGTREGVAYFTNTQNILANSIDASRPIFENRFLLRDEIVTSIAVDGGNRKWLGTPNGVWLFNSTGEELIYNFTTENSPLPSDEIVNISINQSSGEVFIVTSSGLASFRSDATESQAAFVDVKIFPNPVVPNYTGIISIDGLYTDAIVKITDIAGRLVWQTQAIGGTATWNARQLNGNRVGTGMYMVFATAEDGSERHVGKIAVIE